MKNISGVLFSILSLLIVSLVSTTNNTVTGPDSGYSYGLSADLIKKANDSTSDLGGLSAESVEIARN